MITCPSCQSQNLPGTFFCAECGASFLPTRIRETTASLGASTVTGEIPPVTVRPPAPPRDLSQPRLRVVILNSGRKLGFNTDQPITLGRQDSARGFYPDIDLSTDGGVEAGVSRRHAVIKLRDGECYLEDLSSANGTFVNKEQLAANTPRLLQHGDELRLGNILIRIELTS